MFLTMLLAAAAEAPAEESLGFSLEPLWHDSGLPLAVMGMTVVFFALLTISVFIGRLPRLMALLEGTTKSQAPQSQAAAGAAAADEDEELIAVIAAAVEATLGPDHRVIQTQEITSRRLAWAQQGRWQHQTSHRPR